MRTTRWAAAVVAVAVMVTVTSCSGGPTVQPKQAKQDIEAIVQRSTDGVGSSWTPRSAARLGTCPSGDGVTWIYIVDGQASDDPSKDVAAKQHDWDGLGITTERYQSGSADPILGVRGHGGPVTSVDFYADRAGYTITGQSQCAAGNLTDLDPNDF